ncbi:MAG TPA: hypothetical protein DD979_10795 [Gammaproteobacteria bacterium]|nr:hypothetical protein [Gammaproteobacteria bacterium]
MKKVLLYVLLGVCCYLLFMVLRFPAAPIVARFDVSPLTLSGVSGPVWNATIDTLEAPNDVLPTGPERFRVEQVSWSPAPMQLLAGRGGAHISFNAYGGQGEGVVAQSLGGDTHVSDFHYSAEGQALSVLLDPFAKIAGQLAVSVDELVLENQVFSSMQARIEWQDARLLEPTPARLGNLRIDIEPDGDQHTARISAEGGDVVVNGQVDVQQNGNYQTDLTIRPRSGAPRELTDMLRGMGRAASDGSYRIRRKGNVRRMM